MTSAIASEAAANWVITGGCGFIGRSLVARLLKAGVPSGRIRIVDNLSVGTLQDLEAAVQVRSGSAGWTAANDGAALHVADIRDGAAIKEALKGADVIVHLAACTGVQPSVENPFFDCETNVIGTLNCLEAARLGSAKRFVFASSGAPLGNVTPPIHEEVVPHPISPYGASKMAGEGYCSAYFHCFGLETVALRFGNVYGPLSSKKSSIVAKFIRRALASEPLEIYGDGSATRDYIFIEDLTRAIILAVTRAGTGGEIFQIATNHETTVGEVTAHLVDILAANGITGVTVVHGDARKGDMQRNYSDTTKAKTHLGWTCEHTLRQGLEHTVSWFLSQKHKD